MSDTLTVLGWLALITLCLAIARQLSEQKPPYLLPDAWGVPFSQKGWDLGKAAEGFTNSASTTQISGIQAQPGLLSPGDPELRNRENYALLKDVLPVKNKEGTLSAKSCFDTDFMSHSDKVGNYIQRTNNFKHMTPDSCTAPLTEMVDSFYKN